MRNLISRILAAAAAGVLAGGVVAIAGPGVAGAQEGSPGRAVAGASRSHALAAAPRPALVPAPPRRPRVSAPLLKGAGSASPAAVTFARTYSVDTTSDLPWAAGACASGNAGTCSLRAAVAQANTDGTLDEIVLPAGSYSLESDQLVITDAAGVYLKGAGAATTTVAADSSSASYPFRVFQVSSGAQATILGLTIKGGDSSTSATVNPEDGYGGGIEVLDGTLNLRSSTVTANESDHNGAGIYVAGQNSITGAVQSQAYLRSDTISGNTAVGTNGLGDGNGGGLDDEGQAQADHVTITGNNASSNGSGGGIAVPYMGSYGPSLEGTALTVTANSSRFQGGGIYNEGTLELTGSAIGTASAPNTSGAGGGLDSTDVTTLVNTKVHGNTTSGDGAGILAGGQFTMTGGSITGNAPAPSASPSGGGLFVSEFSSTVLNKVAVSDNSAYVGGGIYEFDRTSSVTVNGGSVSGNTAAASGGGIFGQSGSLTMTGGSITANTATGDGGGIWDNGQLNLTKVTVGTPSAPNTASAGDGGGIYAQNAVETISRTRIAGNTASNSGSGDGGGIYTFEAETDLTDSTVNANSADGSGGGIYNAGNDIHIKGSTISANTAAAQGGGIDNEAGLTMTNDTVALNDAGTSSTPGSGAGIYDDAAANATLTNLTISGNTALDSGNGGGVGDAAGATAHLKGTILAGNTGAAGQANCGGSSVSSTGFNLEDDASCALSGPGDLNTTNPQLGALAANGGPTQTEAIPATSPAVDADASCPPPATDQRGASRGQPCDIGAYENPSK